MKSFFFRVNIASHNIISTWHIVSSLLGYRFILCNSCDAVQVKYSRQCSEKIFCLNYKILVLRCGF